MRRDAPCAAPTAAAAAPPLDAGHANGDARARPVLHVQREFNPLRLMLNSGLLWLGIIGLAVLAYVFTRLRGRRLERAWEEEEKAQDLLE